MTISRSTAHGTDAYFETYSSTTVDPAPHEYTGNECRRSDTFFCPTMGASGINTIPDLPADGPDRPDWVAPIFRFTSKISRQVLRFLKQCFYKPASPALYERELCPTVKEYL